MPRNLEQDRLRREADKDFGQKLVELDSAFFDLKARVDALIAFRAAIAGDEAGIVFGPDDVANIDTRLGERHTAIGVWYNALPVGG